MVSSGDLPSDFNLASFFARSEFRVFQHNRAFLLLPVAEAERPVSASKAAHRRPDPTHESLVRWIGLPSMPKMSQVFRLNAGEASLHTS